MAAHRWWRIFITAWGGGFNPGVGDIQFRAVVGGPSVVAGGVAIADSSFSGANTPDKAFDGNAATVWSAATGGVPHWIGYAWPIGNPVDIEEIRWIERADGGGWPSAVSVQWSDDGITYTTAWTYADAVAFAAGEARNYARPHPAKPTIVAVANINGTATLNGDAYVGPAGDTSGHGASQWQVALATDPAFAAPVYDSNFTAANKLTITPPGLPLGVPLIARVRYRSVGEGMSAYSDASGAFLLISATWTQVDLGPDVVGAQVVTLFIDLGPIAGIPFDTPTLNPHAVYDGIDVLYTRVTVNPPGRGGIVGASVQREFGTGAPSATPLTLVFTPPIRGFKVTAVQVDYPGGTMKAKDAGGNVLDTKIIDPLVGIGFAVSVTVEIQRAAAEIKTIELQSDLSDWMAWQAMYMTYERAATGGWDQTDLDPATAWAEADAAPATVWS